MIVAMQKRRMNFQHKPRADCDAQITDVFSTLSEPFFPTRKTFLTRDVA